jgi:hypothetical protein
MKELIMNIFKYSDATVNRNQSRNLEMEKKRQFEKKFDGYIPISTIFKHRYIFLRVETVFSRQILYIIRV